MFTNFFLIPFVGVDFCQTYDIDDPVEFVEQWMAFTVSHLHGAEPSLENLNDFERKELIPSKKEKAPTNVLAAAKKRAEDVSAVNLKVYGQSTNEGFNDDGDNVMDSYIYNTPKVNINCLLDINCMV